MMGSTPAGPGRVTRIVRQNPVRLRVDFRPVRGGFNPAKAEMDVMAEVVEEITEAYGEGWTVDSSDFSNGLAIAGRDTYDPVLQSARHRLPRDVWTVPADGRTACLTANGSVHVLNADGDGWEPYVSPMAVPQTSGDVPDRPAPEPAAQTPTSAVETEPEAEPTPEVEPPQTREPEPEGEWEHLRHTLPNDPPKLPAAQVRTQIAAHLAKEYGEGWIVERVQGREVTARRVKPSISARRRVRLEATYYALALSGGLEGLPALSMDEFVADAERTWARKSRYDGKWVGHLTLAEVARAHFEATVPTAKDSSEAGGAKRARAIRAATQDALTIFEGSIKQRYAKKPAAECTVAYLLNKSAAKSGRLAKFRDALAEALDDRKAPDVSWFPHGQRPKAFPKLPAFDPPEPALAPVMAADGRWGDVDPVWDVLPFRALGAAWEEGDELRREIRRGRLQRGEPISAPEAIDRLVSPDRRAVVLRAATCLNRCAAWTMPQLYRATGDDVWLSVKRSAYLVNLLKWAGLVRVARNESVCVITPTASKSGTRKWAAFYARLALPYPDWFALTGGRPSPNSASAHGVAHDVAVTELHLRTRHLGTYVPEAFAHVDKLAGKLDGKGVATADGALVMDTVSGYYRVAIEVTSASALVPGKLDSFEAKVKRYRAAMSGNGSLAVVFVVATKEAREDASVDRAERAIANVLGASSGLNRRFLIAPWSLLVPKNLGTDDAAKLARLECFGTDRIQPREGRDNRTYYEGASYVPEQGTKVLKSGWRTSDEPLKKLKLEQVRPDLDKNLSLLRATHSVS